MIKEIKKKKRKRPKRRRMAGVVSATNNCGHNSQCYVMCIFDPWGMQGVRIPQPLGTGTAVTTLFTRQFPATTGAAGRWVGGFQMRPNLEKFAATVTASTAINAVTWTLASHPKTTSMSQNATSYRTVSAGFRLMDVGAMIERGMSLYVGRVPPLANTAIAPDTDLIDFITSSPSFELIDLAKLKPDGSKVVWIPYTFGSTSSTSSAGIASNGTTFRGITADIIDSFPTIMFVSTRADTPSDEVAIETVMNIEFIPPLEDEFLFHRQEAMGGPSDVAHAAMSIASHPVAKAVAKTGHHGSYSVLKDIWGKTQPMRQFLSDAWADLGGFSGLVGDGAKMLELARVETKSNDEWDSVSKRSRSTPRLR